MGEPAKLGHAAGKVNSFSLYFQSRPACVVDHIVEAMGQPTPEVGSWPGDGRIELDSRLCTHRLIIWATGRSSSGNKFLRARQGCCTSCADGRFIIFCSCSPADCCSSPISAITASGTSTKPTTLNAPAKC